MLTLLESIQRVFSHLLSSTDEILSQTSRVHSSVRHSPVRRKRRGLPQQVPSSAPPAPGIQLPTVVTLFQCDRILTIAGCSGFAILAATGRSRPPFSQITAIIMVSIITIIILIFTTSSLTTRQPRQRVWTFVAAAVRSRLSTLVGLVRVSDSLSLYFLNFLLACLLVRFLAYLLD